MQGNRSALRLVEVADPLSLPTSGFDLANNPPTEAISKDLAELIRVPKGIAAKPARWQHSRRVQMAVEHGPK